MIQRALTLVLLLAPLSLPAAEPTRVVMRETRQGVLIEDLIFKNSLESYEVAYRICPAERKAAVPAILFVHWLDSSEPTSGRSQYVDEAVTLAQRGACSLLVQAIWSNPDWFSQRDPAKDRVATERQAARIKSAVDFLLDSPGIDKTRVAYVGHDFGGMFGALLAAEERRVKLWAFQAGTARWHDWYLFSRKLEGAEREKAIATTTAIDPIVQVAKAQGSFLFQFGKTDPYVPVEVGQQFYAAAPEPKQILWYEAGHDLNPKASEDRIAWLTRSLGLQAE
jgi:dienelactone hydrolase